MKNKKRNVDLKSIDEIHNSIKNTGYGKYYCEPSSLRNLKRRYHHNPGVNCSDIDMVDEYIEEQKKRYFKKHILREMTPEEKEWFDSQPKIDLNSPEHEPLKKLLLELKERGWFD